jgi:hypothetical protein
VLYYDSHGESSLLYNQHLQVPFPKDITGKILDSLATGAELTDTLIVDLFVHAIRHSVADKVVLVNFPKSAAQAKLLERAFWPFEESIKPLPGNVSRFKYLSGPCAIPINESLLYPSITMHSPLPPKISIFERVVAMEGPQCSVSTVAQLNAAKEALDAFADKDFGLKYEVADYVDLVATMKEFYGQFGNFDVSPCL